MRRRVIAVGAVLSLLFGAGIASANTEETDPREDTLFNFGYDPQAQLFFFNINATDSSVYDCTLENGTLTATYGGALDGTVPVDELLDDQGVAVSFEPSSHDLAAGIVMAKDPVTYMGAEGDCGISGVTVGAQGHINHGQFMKLFNELIDMPGRGCINRWLAQSDLGKGDQQVRTPDFDDEIVIGPSGLIDFTTVIADCNHGNQDTPEDHPGRGHAGATHESGGDHGSRGKSGDAPGHNK